MSNAIAWFLQTTKLLLGLVFTIGSLAVLLILLPRFIIRWFAQQHPRVLFFANTNYPVVALTIDDGPNNVNTSKILDVLSKYQVHATFFLIGNRISGNEKLVERIVGEGHELGNHLMRNVTSLWLSPKDFDQQLLKADRILIQYAPVRWLRPGRGWFNKRLLDQIEEQGYKCALGSIYPHDAFIPFVGFLTTHILFNISPGSVIILHDGKSRGKRTVTILQKIIPEIQKRGYRIVTLSELVEFAQHTK